MCFTLILWFLLLVFLCLVFDDYDKEGVRCSRSQYADKYHYSRNMVTCLNRNYNIVRHTVSKLTFGQISYRVQSKVVELAWLWYIYFFSWGVHELEKRLRSVLSNDSQVFSRTKFSILFEHKFWKLSDKLWHLVRSLILSNPRGGQVSNLKDNRPNYWH